MGPHTCTIGTHARLEEIGKPYDTEKIDVNGSASEKPEVRGQPEREGPDAGAQRRLGADRFGAIATWLARTTPEAGLLPNDPESEARSTEVVEYVEGTIHGQGFGRLFKQAKYEP